MRHTDSLEGFARILRPVEARVERVDHVGILRIGVDPSVVERPLPQHPLVVGPHPGGTGVVGAEDATLVVLDQRVDARGSRWRDRYADLAQQTAWW